MIAGHTNAAWSKKNHLQTAELTLRLEISEMIYAHRGFFDPNLLQTGYYFLIVMNKI